MNYRINLTYQGGRDNHIANPLVKLDGTEYALYSTACDAIADVLGDVFRSAEGYQRLKRTPLHLAFADVGDGVYIGQCRGLIQKEGFAEHYGVTATVEEVAQ